MCLNLKSAEQIPEIASKNIICFKDLDEREGSYFAQHYLHHEYFVGELNEPMELKIRIRDYGANNISYEVKKGYHSSVKCRLEKENYKFLFIIPKGTKYFKGLINNSHEGYTSEQIIMLGSIFKLSTWWRYWKNYRK